MSLTEISRMIERTIFGALVGTLGGVLACRIALLATDLHFFWLLALLAVGAWSGSFFAYMRTGESELATRSLHALASTFRQFCLRTMLWLLGAAAVFGVLSVLTASYDLVGRLAGTAAITALAAGLLWPFSILMDREDYRGVGLFGAVSVIVAYMLVIPTVWNVGHQEEEAAVSSLLIALMLPAGVATLLLMRVRAARVSGLLGTAVYAAVLASFLIAIWYPRRWYSDDYWWETGTAFAAFGPMAMANLVGAGTDDRRHWRWLGVLFAVAGCGVCLWGTWKGEWVPERVIAVICTVPIVVAHANLSLYLPLRPGQQWLRIATVCMVALTALFLDIDLLFELSRHGPISLVGRAALAAGILASCGTLALVILAALNRGSGVRVAKGGIESMTVFCPQCGKKQSMSLQSATCVKCGLIVQICIKEVQAAGSPFQPAPHGAG